MPVSAFNEDRCTVNSWEIGATVVEREESWGKVAIGHSIRITQPQLSEMKARGQLRIHQFRLTSGSSLLARRRWSLGQPCGTVPRMLAILPTYWLPATATCLCEHRECRVDFCLTFLRILYEFNPYLSDHVARGRPGRHGSGASRACLTSFYRCFALRQP